ncbi:MAG: hypothetical protein ABEL76_01310 [Bradymonadaceae bacterium]
MGLFDTVRKAIAGKKYDNVDQSQSEALIDALTFTMVAEGKVPEVEREELKNTLDEIEWTGSVDIDSYVEQSLEKARSAESGEEGQKAFLNDVADRLDDETLEEEAYFLAARIAGIDKEVDTDETDVLRTMVEVFDIPRKRLKAITRELRQQM